MMSIAIYTCIQSARDSNIFMQFNFFLFTLHTDVHVVTTITEFLLS